MTSQLRTEVTFLQYFPFQQQVLASYNRTFVSGSKELNVTAESSMLAVTVCFRSAVLPAYCVPLFFNLIN